MKLLSLFLCTHCLLLSAQAGPPKARKPVDSTDAVSALRLEDLTRLALAQNPAIQAAHAKWEAWQQRIPQAAAWDDPRVGANTRLGRFVNVAPNSFTDQMWTVEQMVPVSGKNLSRARIAAAEAVGALEELRRAQLEVAAKVRTAYYQLARDYALLDLNHEDETSLQQSLEVMRAKLAVGGQSQTDALTAEAELMRIAEARRDLERQLAEEQTQLNVLTHREALAAIARPAAETLSLRSEPPPESRLRAAMLASRPEVRLAEAGVTAAQARLQLAQRDWFPDPTLSLQAQRYNEGSQVISEVSAGVSFNIPWVNGRKYRAEEKEAALNVEVAQRELDGSRAEALGALHSQLQKIDTLHHHAELFAARLVPNARQIVETNRTNYEAGRATFLDLVGAQHSLRETQAMQLAHLADYRIAMAELDSLVGADPGPAKPHTGKNK